MTTMDEFLEKVNAWNEALDKRLDALGAPDIWDELEKKSRELVQKGRFDSQADAQTHLLETDPEIRRQYLDGTGGSDRSRAVKGNSGQRELLQKAERKVAAGEADSLADAMGSILDNNPELARRAGYRV